MTVFLCLIQGFLSLFSLIRVMQLSTANPLTILLFAGATFIYYQFTKNSVACKIRVSDQCCSFILATIFSLLTLLAKYNVLILNTSFFAERFIITVLTGIGLVIIYFYALLALFVITAELDWTRNLYPLSILPFFTFLGSLIVYGFYFACEYPGILTPSTQTQFQEINGAINFSDNPSLVYTVLIDKLYKLFHAIFNSETTSIAALTFLQIIFISFIAGYVVKTLQKAHVHSFLCTLTAIFYLLPYNAMMAVTLSYDVLFAANLIGYMAVLIRLLLKSDQKIYTKKKWFSIILPYFIFGFMICSLSRNGLIIFVVTLPFIILSLLEKWKIILPVTAVIAALLLFIKFPFIAIYEIDKPSWLSLVSPTLLTLVNGSETQSSLDLLKQFVNESKTIWFPFENAVQITTTANELALLSLPAYLTETVMTMQSCIPLYGLIWSPGIILWLTLTSMFLCGRNEKPENIPFILPIFIFALTLLILPPSQYSFSSVYAMFLALPIIFMMPFLDAESEY